jgi:hypothetical protein
MQCSVTAWETKVVDTDDPRWLASERTVDATIIQPTTLAGVLALLRHACDYEWNGNQWPDRVLGEDENGREKARDWKCWMFNHIADALEGLAVRS